MQCSAKVSSSSSQRHGTACLHKEASISRAEKTECSLLTLSLGDLSTSVAQLPQKRGQNSTEMGKLKVWMKMGSHYLNISGSSHILLYLHKIFVPLNTLGPSFYYVVLSQKNTTIL